MEKCEVCYTCEKGILPDVTIDEAKKKGDVPAEWFVNNCESCFSCQSCFVAQHQCDSCYTCEKGYAPKAEEPENK
jgi:hypothetical protein